MPSNEKEQKRTEHHIISDIENNMYRIDYESIEKWNPFRAFEVLFSCFASEENFEMLSLYKCIDEKDILEITYLILKHSKGTSIPTNEDIESLATKVTILRLSQNKTSHSYSMYNGDMPDVHLFYFLDKLFEPFTKQLLDKYGFDHRIVWQIQFFALFNRSFVFTFDDVKKMAIYSWDDKDAQITILEMFEKFIDYFSGEPKLEDYDVFQKSVSRKPIIKLSDSEYMLCWHWLRNSVIVNFHYLLSSDEAYIEHRGNIVEETTASLFRHHLNSSEIYTSVTYNDREIDVLVDAKDAILLLECKSGILYEDFKLGITGDNVRKNIDSLTGKAKEQLLNAQNAVLARKDMRSKGVKLSLDPNKKIILLNICFEFPIGITNKDSSDDVVVLSLIDLMMIIDLMEDKILGEPRAKNIIDYLDLRKRTLGFATDDELTIAISLLYHPHLDMFIDNPELLSCIQLDSNKSISRINELYSFLKRAKIDQSSSEYITAKNNYKGFLRSYVIEGRF